ncbi:PIN domain-containing protein [Capnocytophaga sputigena]|uniref:type II toxin-antitoxin system VapC family toxin n=1 Tax=Capnocytophaga sputigena TaxID=1019 RepID=UPI0028E2E44B|nr:PIN domain-containing protein [Capnocytophaga sputigena]
MKRIFVDANVLVDLLTERRGFYDDAKKLFNLCKERKITPYISSVSIAIINYLLLKIYNEKKAREELEKIYRLTEILPFHKRIISLAHYSNFKDLEDGFQYFTAKESNINVIITRNQKDFQVNDISIITPKQFIEMFSR